MKIAIHATNIRGLGGVSVVDSLLGPLVRALSGNEVTLFLDETTSVRPELYDMAWLRIARTRRRLPRRISRFLEVLFYGMHIPSADRYLILGDVPLRGLSNQYVLVHQYHLIDPKIEPHVQNDLRFRIMRYLFRKNIEFVKCFLVQTDVVKDGLMQSYGIPNDKIKVLPHPAPDWVKPRNEKRVPLNSDKLTLFYPAAAHPHKNHRILGGMELFRKVAGCEFSVVVTLRPFEIPPELQALDWVRAVGRLSPSECLDHYGMSDALFFPSVLETIALPLVEAMTLGLPVICSDLPFARWVCEDQALFFDPHEPESACRAIRELRERLKRGWKPDWRKPLSKLPGDWESAASRFAAVLLGNEQA